MECHVDRDILEPDDLLVPGRIIHIAAEGRGADYTAFCMKRDLQKRARERAATDTLVFLAIENAEAFADPENDPACLRPDIFQCYGVARLDGLKKAYGPRTEEIVKVFPGRFWLPGDRREIREFFDCLHAAAGWSGVRIPTLSHDKRLEENGGTVTETPVDLNADGMEASERLRVAKSNRGNHRIDFWQR